MKNKIMMLAVTASCIVYAYNGINYEGAGTAWVLAYQNTYLEGAIVVPQDIPNLGYGEAYGTVVGVRAKAFYLCDKITAISLPATVTNIGEYAFYQCTSLSSANIPVGVTVIEPYTFYHTTITAISIPPTIQRIGTAAFAGTKRASVNIPSSVTEIGSSAFGNTSLTSVSIPSSVMEIGSSAFADCSNLTSVNLPYSLRVGNNAFAGCSNLATVTIPGSLCSTNFSAVFGSSQSSIKNITIASATSIGDKAFYSCSNLESLTIPRNLSSIGKNALHGNKLTAFTITDSITSIDSRAFSDCTGLQTVIIADRVNSKRLYIDPTAFSGCTGLKRVVIPGELKGTLNEQVVFGGCSDDVQIEYDYASRSYDPSESINQAFSAGNSVTIKYDPSVGSGTSVRVNLDGNCMLSSQNSGSFVWQPQTLGSHVLTHTAGNVTCTATVNVINYSYFVQPAPNPPMAKDNSLSITPTTRNFGVNGGGNAIITSGSGTWMAAVSDPWITLNATSGNVGYPVAYTVSANTNVEQRTGYVYVSGWVHTITQDGVGGTISPENVTFEHQGGNGTVTVSTQSKMVWQARPNVDWLSVSPTRGAGTGGVTYQVAPYNEVATRQGTLTVAGNTFTVFQYGRRMKLSTYKETQDYETHVIPITVNALAITQWSVTPNASWISVVDTGNGQGSDSVTITIAENPSYNNRTGSVTIGTETFAVTQTGRPPEAWSFDVNPANSTASVEGANGIVVVTATPDLPWTAMSDANWLTIYAATTNGSGNGNVVYSVSPNSKLYSRTGHVSIAPRYHPELTKTHTVTQPAATASISSNGYEFEAAGESCSVDVSCASIVEWSISESLSWLSVNGSTSRVGPGTVTLQATANDTVYPRNGTVTIAGKTFNVSQKARGVELEYDTKLFGTDGGYESISIHPDGNVSWTAVASDATWITIFQGDSGTGDGEIMYIVSPYVGNGTARTGWITVGDKKVYITQRAYDLNIEPNGTNVVGNAGAGEFGVSASIGDVWTAIVTEPWITLVDGYDAGTGSGVVRFLYTENTTGKMRTGKIIVAGEVYTLEQRARTMVAITATAEHGGHVSGGGSYDLGTQVALTAVPDSGYAFSYWTGTVSSMQNPLTVTADVAKSYTAVFAPLPIVLTNVVSDTNGVLLAWNNLAWAGTYRIYRGVTSVPSSATVLVELPNNGNCTYLDETGDVDVEYWYWIEAEGPSDEVMSDPMTGRKEKPIVISSITYENLRGATNPNPATYREGTLVSFQNPGTVTGYTFAGWTPAQITADMTGAQTVRAAWTANSYSIAYNPNGGSGTMNATAMVYNGEGAVASNGFTYAGHVFTGWATNATGEVVYGAGQSVSNLTAQTSGVVTLYAVWEDLIVAEPSILCDGVAAVNGNALFTGESCTISLVCATEGASIYYGINAVPRQRESNLYSAPFAISDSCTIYAFAVKDGVKSGDAISVAITKKTLSLGDAAGADATGSVLAWTTGGRRNLHDWLFRAERCNWRCGGRKPDNHDMASDEGLRRGNGILPLEGGLRRRRLFRCHVGSCRVFGGWYDNCRHGWRQRMAILLE